MLQLDIQPALIDQVHDKLLGAIADGTLASGQRLTQESVAAMLGVSRQPVSHALQVLKRRGFLIEHGKRGRPGWHLIQRIIAYFNIIWDEAEEVARLARISHPRITIDTSGLNPLATELANRLADDIGKLEPQALSELLAVLSAKKHGGK